MKHPPASARGRQTEGAVRFLAGPALRSYRDASVARNTYPQAPRACR